MHINSNSLLEDIDKIEMCLQEFDWLIDVIVVSETWIKESEMSYTMLENIYIYINNNLDFNKIDVLSTTIEDVIEIVTVEICTKQNKRI